MPGLNDQLKKISDARTAFNKAENALYLARLSAVKTLNTDNSAVLQQVVSGSSAAFETARKNLNNAIKDLFPQPETYKTLAGSLSADYPVLFFPVRIETRFVDLPGGGQQLWVRIYPDDIHVHTHEPLLTDAEVTAGENYWKALAAANRMKDGDKETKKQAAWQLLREYAGAQRSLWVARQTKPKNWKPDLAVADAALQFPPHTDTKSHPWTKPPRTQVLPDKFIVSIYNNGQWFSHEGTPLPDTLFLGPDPFRAEQAIQKVGDNILPHEDFAWATDFDKAEQNGMALRIDLKPEYFNNGRIERLLVTGILFSADPEKSRELVEQLIENHHYSLNGFSLLPQGTPTNNTEKDDSGYTRNEDTLEKGYYDGAAPSLFANDPACDGKIMADLLGIKGSALEEVPRAGMRERAEAAATNTALYPATLGYYFGVALAPVVPESGLEYLRAFFTKYVSARGPLPAIRVGNQPYGLLLTSDQRGLGAERTPDANFYNPLSKVLQELQKKWDTLAETKVAHVGMGGDPSDVLLKVLGLQAGSVSFQQQLCSTFDFLIATSQGGDATFKNNMLQKQQAVIALLRSLGFNPPNEISYPPVSGLYLHPRFSAIPPKNLVDGLPGSDTRYLPDGNYISWLAGVKTMDELEHLNFGDKGAPAFLLFIWLRHALLNELFRATLDYYRQRGINISHGAFNKGLFNFLPNQPDLTSWELMRGVPKALNLAGFDIDKPLAEYFLGLPDTDPSIAALGEVRKALKTISPLSTAHLERLLADHIDLCTYRLDAWQTGLFYRKLERKRVARPTGLYLGAFGWVNDLQPEGRVALPAAAIPEKLRPENGASAFKLRLNAGFVHTPSLNHATAAGLLLAGHYNHGMNYPPAAGKSKPFAVNLSSERVRRAMFIFEGVQNGQSLDALLGYQFERALHDATTGDPLNFNLNQYIYALREIYPVLRNTLPQQGAAEVQESVSAYPVINGLKLLESPDSDITTLVTDATHATRILKEKNRLADTMDAANDLLVAETAFQASQGNMDRTAGVLNALRNADVPPGLEVVKTPRSSLLTYTSRTTVHFRTDMSHQAGNNWTSKKSPRSVMETGLNRWLGRCIGHPAKVVCRIVQLDENQQERIPKTITLDDLQMHPIDFVYVIGADTKAGIGELEGRIAQVYRKKTNIAPTAPVRIFFNDPADDLSIRTFAQMIPLARALRTLVTTARAASARDFAGRSRTQTGDASMLYGWDATDLESRVKQALDDLKNKIFYIENKAPNENAPPGLPATFKELFNRHAEDGNNPQQLDMTLSENGFDKVTDFLRDASLFGIPLAFPDEPTLLSQPDLLAKAASTWQTMNNKVAAAEKKISDALAETDVQQRVSRLTEAGKAILGDDFLVLPRFHYSNPADMQQTLGDKTQLLKYISKQTGASGDLALESWIQSAAHVRPDLAKLERVRMFTEALGGKLISIQPAQTPFRAKDSWLAVEFPEIYDPTGKPFQIYDDTIALAIAGEAADQVNDLQSAMVVDDWTETIPTDKEVTGIAYHYNQPNAAPPQALLLAVEPTGSDHWNWEVLLGVLDDTLQRAKTRAVEPAHLLEDPVLGTLLPMTLADYDLQQANLSLDFLVANDEFIAKKAGSYALYAPYVKK